MISKAFGMNLLTATEHPGLSLGELPLALI